MKDIVKMPQSTEEIPSVFNVKLQEIGEKKRRTSCFLSKSRYELIVIPLIELSEDSTIKKTHGMKFLKEI